MLEPILPPDVPRPLDQELLAWAAGFFDGEGTTFAKRERRRGGPYYQLDVSVPQLGRDAVPEVLVRFQRAMLGVGAIYAEADGLFKWRAGGRGPAEMSLALLWPWLGMVKRLQAQSARETVRAQYTDGRFVERAAKYRPILIAHKTGSTTSTERDLELAWAAGFMDAEGCFGLTRLPPRKDGTAPLRIRASASQHGKPGVPAEVLTRLSAALGVGSIERHGEIDDFRWVATGGDNVRTVLETLRPWLGDVKVQQAISALEAHEVTRVRGGRDRCIRGHVYDHVYVASDGTVHQRCSACDRLRRSAERAALGIVPRNLAAPPDDPTRAYRV